MRRMIRYYKGDPSEHVIEFVRGRKIRDGRGASFLYRPSRTSIVSVPLNTADADFVVSEVTADFQMVAIQGQITFRISDPAKAATLLNFEINPQSKAYRSKDPPKIQARLANLVQEAARAEIQRLSLEDAIRRGAELSTALESLLRESKDLVVKLVTHVASILPSSESNSEMLVIRGPWPNGLQDEEIQLVETARPIFAYLIGNFLDVERATRQREQLVNVRPAKNIAIGEKRPAAVLQERHAEP